MAEVYDLVINESICTRNVADWCNIALCNMADQCTTSKLEGYRYQ